MDGRRRKQQPSSSVAEKKHNLKNQQTKIKELKKDIETFETEVNLLLEHVQACGSIDNICILCQNHILTSEYHDLPCQHVLCETCVHDQVKNQHSIQCPQCSQQQPHPSPFSYLRPTGSSSSSEDN